jgi:hypothetical protein
MWTSRACVQAAADARTHQHNRPLEVAAFKSFYKLNKLREVVIPGDGRCMFCSFAHQLLGKQQNTFQESDRDKEADRIKLLALEYIRTHEKQFEGFVADDVPGCDRYGAGAEDVGSYVEQMSEKVSYGDEMMLKATALSLKRKIRVFKYDEVGTGVDTAKMSTLLFPAVPLVEDTTCQTINQEATPDMLAEEVEDTSCQTINEDITPELLEEEETLNVAYYAWQGRGPHYNTFLSETVSERSVKPSPVVGNVVVLLLGYADFH